VARDGRIDRNSTVVEKSHLLSSQNQHFAIGQASSKDIQHKIQQGRLNTYSLVGMVAIVGSSLWSRRSMIEWVAGGGMRQGVASNCLDDDP